MIWLFLFFSVLIACPAARADSAGAAAISAFGLEGVWSPDCARPPAHDNPRMVIRVNPDMSVFHGVTFDGSAWSIVDSFADIAAAADDALRFVVIRRGRPSASVVLEHVGQKIRVRSSVGSDGEVYVQDGILMSEGSAVLPDERCVGDVPIS